MEPDPLDEVLGPRLNWTAAAAPARSPLAGIYVTLEPLEAERHAKALYNASHCDTADPALWHYMSYGPFDNADDFRDWVQKNSESTDPHFYAVVPGGREAAGQVTYLRIDTGNGVIETGHIWFGAAIQRSPVATESIYLLAKHAFDDLGYRRFEWKCHAGNQRSRRAAERFGFTFEGIFRNAVVQRDRNRDTAWYSIIDSEWPAIRRGFETWLSPENFDAEGRQIRTLASCREWT